MSIELIRGELERLYSLEEMQALSSELLGFEPGAVGGTASTASFARALTEHCRQKDAIAALIDAVTGTKANASPQLRKFVDDILRAPVELKLGETIGDFKILRKLGAGPNGSVYVAKQSAGDVVLKLLHTSATHDKSALYRFIIRNRLLATVTHDGLPQGLTAGFVDHQVFVAYEHLEGKPLAARVARTGALHLNEARALLVALLHALEAIHQKGLVHGALKLENVIVGKRADDSPHVVLVDGGGDLLASSWVHSDVAIGGGQRIKGLAPEQLKGLGSSPQSDLYAFGALLFEVLTGRPPLEERTATNLAVAHLSKQPAKAVDLAPRGWVSEELSELCGRLLAKDPKDRPSISEVLELLAPVEKPKEPLSATQVEERIDALVADPTDGEAAIALELTLEQGGEARKVAEAFLMAADSVNLDTAEESARRGEESQAVAEAKAEAARDRARSIKKGLLFRAARLFESQVKDHARAEEAYKLLLELDPGNDVARSGYEESLKQQEKYDELIEKLLAVAESQTNHADRGAAFNKIGNLYLGALGDPEQAVFAFAQALAQDVQNADYAADLERAAGDRLGSWAEAMKILHEVSEHPRMPTEPRVSLFLRLGNWYVEKIARPDLALPCFEAALALDPASDALEGMVNVYRRAQQWNELVAVLLKRVERAPTPERARDLRAEAANIYENRLNDLARARDLHEATLKEDPGHPKTVEALGRIYQQGENWIGFVKILERQADALTGSARAEVLCKIAELDEDQLNDLPDAERRYQAAVVADPSSLVAIRGLDRLFNRSGRYKELLENLDRQVALAATPRQKINLYERLAGIHDEEFLNHATAAEWLEKVLALSEDHAAAISGLLRHYRALGRWDEVIALYDRSLRTVTDDDRRAELWMAQGRVLLDHIGSPERARHAYEKVLEIRPSHAAALESLAHLRAATGDAMAALSAVEALAENAPTAENKADLWIRAAKILEEHGDRDGAIVRYKMALDAQPNNAEAAHSLRAAYLARGDAQSAADLVQREIDGTDGKLAKARLYVELATLQREKLDNDEKAEAAATKAVNLNPTSIQALLILGDIAFEQENFVEAATHYGAVASRVDALPREAGKRTLIHYIDALARSGSTEQAKDNVRALLELAGDDHEALLRAARVRLDSGDAKGAAELYEKIEHGSAEGGPWAGKVDGEARGRILVDHGRALRLAGVPQQALAPLQEAADLLPDSIRPIQELSLAYEAQGNWEEVVRIKQRRLDVAEGAERSTLLLEIGEVLATQMKDATRAAKTFVAALEERPDDRKVLTRLMKLYSDEKDWGKLVEVVIKLAEGVDDPKQKAKYIQTAAVVSARHVGDVDAALGFFQQVMALDPDADTPIKEATALREQKGDWEGVVELINMQLERAEKAGDKTSVVEQLERLADIYEAQLGRPEDAVPLLEKADKLDPDNADRTEWLASLYSSDTEQFFDKAIDTQMEIIKKSPYNAQAYRALRKLYTEAKDADPAWCVCQALHVMSNSEPDEERFFRRMRADTAAEASERVTDEDWLVALTHPTVDPLLTMIFTLISPAILYRNAHPLEQLGFQAAYALDLSMHPYPISQTLYYAAGVLGMEPHPLTFQNPNDPGGITFLHAQPPSIVLGAAALAADLPTQAAAFIAARHLAYYRPGMYIRHLVPTGTGLRAWLFAAIRVIHAGFPVAAELETTVRDNQSVIEPMLQGRAREQLASAVAKVLQSGAIDLKKWVAGVDLSADRAGFLVCHDLEVACEMIKASDEATASVPHKDRVRELSLFSIDRAYFKLRKRLGISIDA